MTDGQIFVFAGIAALVFGALVEHYWKRWRR